MLYGTSTVINIIVEKKIVCQKYTVYKYWYGIAKIPPQSAYDCKVGNGKFRKK